MGIAISTGAKIPVAQLVKDYETRILPLVSVRSLGQSTAQIPVELFTTEPIIHDLARRQATIQSPTSKELIAKLQQFFSGLEFPNLAPAAHNLQEKFDQLFNADKPTKVLSQAEKDAYLKKMQKKIPLPETSKTKKKKSIVPKKQTPYDIAMQLAPYVLMSVSATGLVVLGLLELNDRQNQ